MGQKTNIWSLLYYWAVAPFPALLSFLIFRQGEILFVLLPSLYWGGALPSVLRLSDHIDCADADFRLPAWMRTFFCLTVSALLALSAFLLLDATTQNSSISLPGALIVCALSVVYLLAQERRDRGRTLARLIFRRMKMVLLLASFLAVLSSVICMLSANQVNEVYSAGVLMSGLCGWLFLGVVSSSQAKASDRVMVPSSDRLIRAGVWGVPVVLGVVLVGQQINAAGTMIGKAEQQIAYWQERENNAKKFAANEKQFRGAIAHVEEQLRELEALLPVYRGLPEEFGEEAEAIMQRHQVRIVGRLVEAEEKTLGERRLSTTGDCIERLFAWRVQGEVPQVHRALQEIDALPRLVRWVYLSPEISAGTHSGPVLIALKVYNAYSAPRKNASPGDSGASSRRGLRSDKVWLPPFSWAAEKAVTRLRSYTLREEGGLPFAQEFETFRENQKVLSRILNLAEKLDTPDTQLLALLSPGGEGRGMPTAESAQANREGEGKAVRRQNPEEWRRELERKFAEQANGGSGIGGVF